MNQPFTRIMNEYQWLEQPQDMVINPPAAGSSFFREPRELGKPPARPPIVFGNGLSEPRA